MPYEALRDFYANGENIASGELVDTTGWETGAASTLVGMKYVKEISEEDAERRREATVAVEDLAVEDLAVEDLAVEDQGDTEPEPDAEPDAEPEHEIKATPQARELANAYNLDLSDIAGTGDDGQVLINDVRLHIERVENDMGDLSDDSNHDEPVDTQQEE